MAPVVGAVPNASLNVGATYTAAGTFSDPGADAWTATVTWGDGSAPEVVALSGRSFSLTHIYTAAGSYTVSIDIADDDSLGVRDATPCHGDRSRRPAWRRRCRSSISSSRRARFRGPWASLLKAQVIAAQVLIGRGNCPRRASSCGRSSPQIDLLVRLRVVTAADVAALRAIVAALRAVSGGRRRRKRGDDPGMYHVRHAVMRRYLFAISAGRNPAVIAA